MNNDEDKLKKIKTEIKREFTFKEWLSLSKIILFPGKKRIIAIFVTIAIIDILLIRKMLFPIFLKKELRDFIMTFMADSQTVFLALFGIIIMGYTIYQTLLSDEFVFILAATSAEEKGLEKRSRFTVVSNYFYAFCIMTMSLIIFNLIVLSIIKNDKVLKILINAHKNIFENKNLIRIGLWLYIYISLNAIFEIKSFLKTLLDSIKIDAFINKLDNN